LLGQTSKEGTFNNRHFNCNKAAMLNGHKRDFIGSKTTSSLEIGKTYCEDFAMKTRIDITINEKD